MRIVEALFHCVLHWFSWFHRVLLLLHKGFIYLNCTFFWAFALSVTPSTATCFCWIVSVLRLRFQTEALLLWLVTCTEDDSSAQLLRTKSDAGVLRRGQRRSPSDQRKIRRHRFSINGHFYNHKVQQLTKNNKCIFWMFSPLLISPWIRMYTNAIHWCALCLLTDSSVHARLRLSDQRPHQQLHDDASGAAGSPQQV